KRVHQGSRVPIAGILVRLHALGDFYSVGYVAFWDAMLRMHPRLAVFGYTAWAPGSEIGDAIQLLKDRHGRRFAIRWSNGAGDEDAALPIIAEADRPANAFICPEQTGKVDGCGKCGLCWATSKNVAFLEH